MEKKIFSVTYLCSAQRGSLKLVSAPLYRKCLLQSLHKFYGWCRNCHGKNLFSVLCCCFSSTFVFIYFADACKTESAHSAIRNIHSQIAILCTLLKIKFTRKNIKYIFVVWSVLACHTTFFCFVRAVTGVHSPFEKLLSFISFFVYSQSERWQQRMAKNSIPWCWCLGPNSGEGR